MIIFAMKLFSAAWIAEKLFVASSDDQKQGQGKSMDSQDTAEFTPKLHPPVCGGYEWVNVWFSEKCASVGHHGASDV